MIFDELLLPIVYIVGWITIGVCVAGLAPIIWLNDYTTEHPEKSFLVEFRWLIFFSVFWPPVLYLTLVLSMFLTMRATYRGTRDLCREFVLIFRGESNEMPKLR